MTCRSFCVCLFVVSLLGRCLGRRRDRCFRPMCVVGVVVVERRCRFVFERSTLFVGGFSRFVCWIELVCFVD